MPDATGVQVKGLRELQRAFSAVDKNLGRGVREALEAAGEPARQSASQLALGQISGMRRSRISWWRMRVGVTRSSVYIAPEQRGVKGRGRDRFRRRNLADILIVPMEQGVEQNAGRVESQIGQELDDLFAAWGRI